LTKTIFFNQGAEYVLALKGNQSAQYEAVKDFFTVAQAGAFAAVDHDFYKEIDRDHGRLEIRRYGITEELRTLPNTEQWTSLRSIGLVERRNVIGDTETVEQRFYLNAIPADAARFAYAVRAHWGGGKSAPLATGRGVP